MSTSVIAELELVFNGVANAGFVLISSPSFEELERSDTSENIFNKNMKELIEMRNLFSDTAIVNDIIDSLFFYIPDAGIVLHSTGTESDELFFGSTNTLEQYPHQFWQKFTPAGSRFQILLPTAKKSGTPQQRSVVPLIITKNSSQNYIVVLIRVAFLQYLLQNHLITPNTVFTLRDTDGALLATSAEEPQKGIPESAALPNLQQQQTDFLLGDQQLTLHTSFPRSDIIALTHNIRLIIIVSTLLVALLSGIISFLLSRRISRPVETLIEAMRTRNDSDTSSANGIQLLQHGVEQLITQSDRLHKNLTDMTPHVLENYMERLIFDRDITNPWVTEKQLKAIGFSFPYAYFQVILVYISPSDKLFANFTEDDISLLYTGTEKLLRQYLPPDVAMWHIGYEEHSIRMLLNTDGEQHESAVTEAMKAFIRTFKTDPNIRSVTVGAGTLKRGVETIHDSYNEASSAMATARAEAPNSFLRYSNESIRTESYLPEQDANRLTNLLMQGKRELAIQQLEEIKAANRGSGSGDLVLKKLAFRIYQLVLQVLQEHKVLEEELMGQHYQNISLQFGNLGSEKIFTYVAALIHSFIDRVIPLKGSKLEKETLESYLEDNFSRDLSLEDVAQRFNTTAAYLSKSFTKLFGVPFTQYVAEKRISFAVYLLEETRDLSIDEIASICGYNNRIHFTRIFKQRRGVPPSEFRRNLPSGG